MPKVGMEPIRRSALVQATIAEIGSAAPGCHCRANRQTGGHVDGIGASLFWRQRPDISGRNAPYLTEFGAEVARLHHARRPHARAEAIHRQLLRLMLCPATVSAWMTLYAQAPTMPETARLLRMYQRRSLQSDSRVARLLARSPKQDARSLAH